MGFRGHRDMGTWSIRSATQKSTPLGLDMGTWFRGHGDMGFRRHRDMAQLDHLPKRATHL